MCAPVVRQRRAVEIDAGLRRHLGGGGGALLATLTLRHHRGDTLESRLGVIAESMGHVLRGQSWERRRNALGYVGVIKAVEITQSDRNGWHPHSHTLMLFDRPLTENERGDLSAWMFGRWSHVATTRELGSVTRANGVDVRAVNGVDSDRLSEYLTKVEGGWSAGLELARSDRKGHNPFALLRELLATGEARLAALWIEYERATFGRRAIVWSPGLRRRLLGTEQDQPDEALAASEGLDLALLRLLVPAERWNAIRRDATTGRFLSQVEQVAAALMFIADTVGHDLPLLDLPTMEGAFNGS